MILMMEMMIMLVIIFAVVFPPYDCFLTVIDFKVQEQAEVCENCQSNVSKYHRGCQANSRYVNTARVAVSPMNRGKRSRTFVSIYSLYPYLGSSFRWVILGDFTAKQRTGWSSRTVP